MPKTLPPKAPTPQQTIEQLDRNIAVAYRLLAEKSFFSFVKQAWPILEPATPFLAGVHHEALCAHLQAVAEGKLSRLIVTMPPRFGKSIITSVLYGAWVWIRNPSARFLATAHKFDLSTDLSIKALKVIASPWYQANWGHVVKLDRQTLEVFSNTAQGERRCSAYDSCMGMGASGLGGALLIDDPHGISLSEDVRKLDLQIYDQGLHNRVSNGAAIICVAQRLHVSDLCGHLIDLGGYEVLELPNEYEPDRAHTTSIGWTDPRTEPGELLWPIGFDAKATADAKKTLGSFAYRGQYQAAPLNKFGNLLNPAWFRTWTKHTLPESFDDMLISSDFAFKGSKDSDFVVLQAWGRSKAEYFLLDQARGQWDFVETLRRFQSFINKHSQITTKLIEDAANGPAIVSTLRKSIAGIIAIKIKDSKQARASAVAPIIESGNVFIPADANWKDDFLAEIAAFPSASTHDDQVDAMTLALGRFEGRRKQDIEYITHSIV